MEFYSFAVREPKQGGRFLDGAATLSRTTEGDVHKLPFNNQYYVNKGYEMQANAPISKYSFMLSSFTQTFLNVQNSYSVC